MTDKNIKHIVGPLGPIEKTQFGVELIVDPVTGYIMWGGKDSNGDVTRWLALDKNARLSDLELTGDFLTTVVDFKENVTPVPATRRVDWHEDENAPAYYSSVSGARNILGKNINIPSAYNDTGVAIPAGVPCKVVGAFSGRPGLVPIGSLTYEAEDMIAFPKNVIPIGSHGEALWFGAGEGLNTGAFAADAKLYLSETVGEFTETPPADKVFIGRCLVSSTTVGRILFAGVSGGNAGHILHPEPEYIDLITGLAAPPYKKGRISWDEENDCPAYYDSFTGTWVQMPQELLMRACNDTGVQINNGQLAYGSGSDGMCLYVGLAKADTYDRNQVLAVATVDVPAKNLPTETGVGKFIKFGVVRDFSTVHLTEGKRVFADIIAGELTSTRPVFPATPIIVGYCIKSHATEGSIFVDISPDLYDYEFDGCVVEAHDYTIEIGTGGDAGKIFLDAEKKGGGDMAVQLQGSRYLVDCTTGAGVDGKARVELTTGADDAPLYNEAYIALVGAVPTLQASTVAPTGAFAPVGRVSLWSAAKTDTDGVAMDRRTTDAIADEDMGHIARLNERIRALGSQWKSGVNATVSITTNAGVMDSLDVEVLTGTVWQLRRQTFPVLQLSVDGAYITNSAGGAVARYEKILDGGLALQTADGTAIGNNRYFNMLVFGAINKETFQCKFYYGFPTDTYASSESAYNDTSGFSKLTVDAAISEVVFPIVRIPLQRTAVNGGTLKFINAPADPEVYDLRGVPLNASATGGAGVAGVSSLPQLSDTKIITPVEGESLVQDGDGFWINRALSLNDAANVDPNLAREIDVSAGAITGIVGSGKPLDAVNLSQLRLQSMGVGSVLSVLDAAPTLATEVVGNKYLVGVGTGLFAGHDGCQAEVIGRRIDPTVLRHSAGASDGTALAYAPDKNIYVVVADSLFLYSYDNITYYSSPTPTTENFASVEYIEEWGVFVACSIGPVTYSFARSTDGVTWTLIVGNLKAHRGLAYHKGLKELHATCSTGTIRASYSSDEGLTWSDSGIDISTETWVDTCYSEEHGAILAVNITGATANFGYSYNGRNWFYSSVEVLSWKSIVAFGKRVAMCSYNGTDKLWYTDDLINWTSVVVYPSDDHSWKAIAYGEGVLFMVAANADEYPNAVAYSLDGGDTWVLVGTGAIETGTTYRDVVHAKGAFASIGEDGAFNSFVTDHVKDFLFKPPAEGDRVFDIAAMTEWLYQGGMWTGDFVWNIEGVLTTCASGDDSDSVEVLSPVIFVAGKMLSLETFVTGTLKAGAGAVLQHKRYDSVSYDGHLNNTPEVKQDSLIGGNGITSAGTFIASDTPTFTPSGKMKVTVMHGTTGAAAETIVEWSVKMRGKWHVGVGNFC